MSYTKLAVVGPLAVLWASSALAQPLITPTKTTVTTPTALPVPPPLTPSSHTGMAMPTPVNPVALPTMVSVSTPNAKPWQAPSLHSDTGHADSAVQPTAIPMTTPTASGGPDSPLVSVEKVPQAVGSPPGIPDEDPSDMDEIARLTHERDVLKLRNEVDDLKSKSNGGALSEHPLLPSITPSLTPLPSPSLPSTADARQVPTVIEVVGTQNNLRCRVQLPGGTIAWLRPGDVIEGGLRVRRVGQDSVTFVSSDGKHTYTQPVSAYSSLAPSTGAFFPAVAHPPATAFATPLTPGSP